MPICHNGTPPGHTRWKQKCFLQYIHRNKNKTTKPAAPIKAPFVIYAMGINQQIMNTVVLQSVLRYIFLIKRADASCPKIYVINIYCICAWVTPICGFIFLQIFTQLKVVVGEINIWQNVTSFVCFMCVGCVRLCVWSASVYGVKWSKTLPSFWRIGSLRLF